MKVTGATKNNEGVSFLVAFSVLWDLGSEATLLDTGIELVCV